MTDLINGRTPMTKVDIERVKKDLHACISDECCECSESLCFSCQDYLRAGALLAIEHLEAQQPKWISVEERLPKHAISAFVYARLCVGGRIHKIGSTYISLFMPPTKSWRDVPDGWKVTHWMPLPEPPEEASP
jgi:hypothetical protein